MSLHNKFLKARHVESTISSQFDSLFFFFQNCASKEESDRYGDTILDSSRQGEKAERAHSAGSLPCLVSTE